jgi:hypothetical protein
MSKFHRPHRVSRIDPAAKHGFPGSTEFAHPTGLTRSQLEEAALAEASELGKSITIDEAVALALKS